MVEAPQDRQRVEALFQEADSLQAEGAWKDAAQRFGQAVEFCRSAKLGQEEIRAHLGLAWCCARLQKNAAATHEYETAQKQARRAGDAASLFMAVSSLGPLYLQLGRWDDGLKVASQALEMARSAGDRGGEVVSLGLLGQLLRRKGDLDGALNQAMDGLALAQEIGDVAEELAFLADMTLLAMGKGELAEAEEIAQRGLERAETHEIEVAVSVFLGHLCQIARRNGDLPRSRVFAERGLEIARKVGNLKEQAAFLQDLGGLAEAEQDFTSSIRLLREGLDLLEKVGNREGLVLGYRRLGLLMTLDGDVVRGLGAIAHAMMLAFPMDATLFNETFSSLFEVCAHPWVQKRDSEMVAGLEHIDRALRELAGQSDKDLSNHLLLLRRAVEVLSLMGESEGDPLSPEIAQAQEMAAEVDLDLGTDLRGFLEEGLRARHQSGKHEVETHEAD
jgi:tetratricopeptide (TPR) repeat protein